MRYVRTAVGLLVAMLSPLASAQEGVEFARRPAAIGDVMRQSVEFRLQMEVKYLQAGETTPGERTELVRRQSRIVEVHAIEGTQVTAAGVTFVNAAQEIQAAGTPAQNVESPISGKTYRVVRQGKRLHITDTTGAIPPFAEYELVATAMASLGRPNPLASFLAGKSVRIGETLNLPQALAGLFFEGAEDVDEVTRFELTLRGRQDIENRSCGVFDLRLDAESGGPAAMGMQITGRIVVDTESCRVMDIRVTGPVQLAERRGPAGGQYDVSGVGELRVAMAASYDDAE